MNIFVNCGMRTYSLQICGWNPEERKKVQRENFPYLGYRGLRGLLMKEEKKCWKFDKNWSWKKIQIIIIDCENYNNANKIIIILINSKK